MWFVCIFSASTIHNSGCKRKEKQQLYAATEGEEYHDTAVSRRQQKREEARYHFLSAEVKLELDLLERIKKTFCLGLVFFCLFLVWVFFAKKAI